MTWKKWLAALGVAMVVFGGGWGTAALAHECGEPQVIEIECKDVEVTCECKCENDPCEVTVEAVVPPEPVPDCHDDPVVIRPAWFVGATVDPEDKHGITVLGGWHIPKNPNWALVGLATHGKYLKDIEYYRTWEPQYIYEDDWSVQLGATWTKYTGQRK